MTQTKPKEQVKFYADSPDGQTVNKYFCYPTYDLEHSADVCGRFLKDGWKIRAGYHVYANGKSVKILRELMEMVKDQSAYQMRRQTENDWDTLKEIQKGGRKVTIPKPKPD